MNKINKIKKIFSAKSPVIFAGLALIGLGCSVASAIHDTPKAIKLLEEERQLREENDMEPMTTFEKVKVAAPAYIPTLITTIGTGGCIIASAITGEKRYAALASACAVAETGLRTYQESVKEVLTPEDVKKVEEAVATKKVESAPIKPDDILFTGYGETLCYETLSGRYFRSSANAIEHAINIFNRRLTEEVVMSLNDLYGEMNIPNTKAGNILGWDVSDGLIEPCFRSKLDELGNPCLVIDYSIEPKHIDY
jgi:hypothetical protein